MRHPILLLASGLCLVIALSACNNRSEQLPAGMEPTSLNSQSAEAPSTAPQSEGEGLFEMNCATCHGVHGNNNPAADFSAPDWQKRYTDAQIKQIIRDGRGGMPAFETTFTDTQLSALVKHLRSFGKGTST